MCVCLCDDFCADCAAAHNPHLRARGLGKRESAQELGGVAQVQAQQSPSVFGVEQLDAPAPLHLEARGFGNREAAQELLTI